MNKHITYFLIIGKLEGYSYLILLFIAMPLKYIMNMPDWVRVAGTLHGVLFVAFMVIILNLLVRKMFGFRQAILAFLLSLVPFGTFFLKKIL